MTIYRVTATNKQGCTASAEAETKEEALKEFKRKWQMRGWAGITICELNDDYDVITLENYK